MKKRHIIVIIFFVLLTISQILSLFGSKVQEEFEGSNELISYISEDDNVESIDYIEEADVVIISIFLEERKTSNQRSTTAIYNYLLSPNVFEGLRGKSAMVEYYHDGKLIRLDEIETISSPDKTDWTTTLY